MPRECLHSTTCPRDTQRAGCQRDPHRDAAHGSSFRSQGLSLRESWHFTPSVPGLRGRVSTNVSLRWIDARHTTICDVLRPFGPRPVPLLMSAERVGQPTGSDPGECDLAGRPVDGFRSLRWNTRFDERPRGRRIHWTTPAAALGGERPHGEQGEEDQQGDRGAVAVKREPILVSPAQGRNGAPACRGRAPSKFS